MQIALLFLPGIIWERIHATYVLKDKPEQFDVIRRPAVEIIIAASIPAVTRSVAVPKD